MALAMTPKAPTVIVTRPEPDASQFAAALARSGFCAIVSPLLDIRPEPFQPLPFGAVIAFTSSNGVRCVTPAQAGLAFAVGATTAAAARAAGWPHVVEADGDVATLAQSIASASARGLFHGPVIHVAGRHRAGDLVAMLVARGIPAERRVAYEAVAAPRLSPQAQDALFSGDDGACVTLFSARSASVFMRIIDDGGLRGGLAKSDVICLSKAVAAQINIADWRRLGIAGSPDAASMIDAISTLSARLDP